MESVCWTCARGRALPDPQGCGWIRSGGQELPDGAKVHIKTSPSTGDLTVITYCPQYVRSAKAKVVRSEEENKLLQEEADRKSEALREKKYQDKVRRATIRYCRECGQPIPAESPLHVKYCKKECWRKHQAEKEKKEREEKRAQIPERACVVCGTMFVHIRPNVKTCGPECSKINRNRLCEMANEERRQRRKAKRNPVVLAHNEVKISRDNESISPSV